jgi:hypothetical protein
MPTIPHMRAAASYAVIDGANYTPKPMYRR